MQKDNRVKEKERLKRIQPRPEHTHTKNCKLVYCVLFLFTSYLAMYLASSEVIIICNFM